MRDFCLILIGAICSTVGGIVAFLIQAAMARRIRRDELIGEQSLEAAKKALSLTDLIYTLRIQGVTEDILKLLQDEGHWFSMSQVLLPHAFVENWRTLRIRLRQLKRRESYLDEITDEAEKEEKIKEKEIGTMEEFIDKLIEEMDVSIRKELGMKKVCIKKFKYEK